jgi:hypothetical protein
MAQDRRECRSLRIRITPDLLDPLQAPATLGYLQTI